MKAHKQATPNFTDKEFPLLPWDRQKAIMEFFLYGNAINAMMYEDTIQRMNDTEFRFLGALRCLIDAFASAPDERYRKILGVSADEPDT